jgi:hypothetical protein
MDDQLTAAAVSREGDGIEVRQAGIVGAEVSPGGSVPLFDHRRRATGRGTARRHQECHLRGSIPRAVHQVEEREPACRRVRVAARREQLVATADAANDDGGRRRTLGRWAAGPERNEERDIGHAIAIDVAGLAGRVPDAQRRARGRRQRRLRLQRRERCRAAPRRSREQVRRRRRGWTGGAGRGHRGVRGGGGGFRRPGRLVGATASVQGECQSRHQHPDEPSHGLPR